MTEPRLFLNAEGNVVTWEELDDVEQRFYSSPTPWEVSEFGLTVHEYDRKVRRDELLACLYENDP